METIPYGNVVLSLLEVDILHFAGLSFILIGGLRAVKAPWGAYPVVAILLGLLNYLVRGASTGNPVVDSLWGLLWGTGDTSYFPFLSWVFYPLAGVAFGALLRRCEDKRRFYLWSLLAGCVALFISAWIAGFRLLHYLGIPEAYAYYHHDLLGNIIIGSLTLIWLSSLYLLQGAFPAAVLQRLKIWSRDLTTIYLIHWVLNGKWGGEMTPKIRVKAMAVAAALVLCLSLISDASASAVHSKNATKAGMAYNGPADLEKNAVHLFASTFKEYVETRTNGRIEIVLYPESQLGNEDERMELVKDGLLQVNVASYAGMAPVVPELFAASIPFMFNSYKAAHKFFDEGEYWKKIQALFQKRTGSLLLEAVEEGEFLAFTNSKREIRSPKDFAGLKFRAMDNSQVALYESFGASGIPIPWTEVYAALQTGVADGQMNPPMYIIAGSLYEVQNYMTLANIQYSDQFLVANGEWFDSLSKEDQEIVRDAAHEANIITRADVEARGKERLKFIADHGVKVYQPTAAEMDEFRRIGQTSYIEWLKKQVDPVWVDMALKDAAWANKEVSE